MDDATLATGAVIILLLGVFAFSSAQATANQAAHDGQLALGLSSIWLVEKHQEEISEALEKIPADFDEASDEAKEIKDWLNALHWGIATESNAKKLALTFNEIEQNAQKRDLQATTQLLEKTREIAKDLHHDLHHEAEGNLEIDGH